MPLTGMKNIQYFSVKYGVRLLESSVSFYSSEYSEKELKSASPDMPLQTCVSLSVP